MPRAPPFYPRPYEQPPNRPYPLHPSTSYQQPSHFYQQPPLSYFPHEQNSWRAPHHLPPRPSLDAGAPAFYTSAALHSHAPSYSQTHSYSTRSTTRPPPESWTSTSVQTYQQLNPHSQQRDRPPPNRPPHSSSQRPPNPPQSQRHYNSGPQYLSDSQSATPQQAVPQRERPPRRALGRPPPSNPTPTTSLALPAYPPPRTSPRSYRHSSPKTARALPVASPSPAYLSSSLLPVFPIRPSPSHPSLLILDLNNTLLFRKSGGSRGSSAPVLRPYLATFLAYVCGPEGEGRRWEAAVYSSAKSRNVLSMLVAMGLVEKERVARMREGERWVAREGDPLRLVWAREMMELSEQEFERNVVTVKDLSKVWEHEGRWGSERSVLLDDEAFKASLQPYNHLPIKYFEILRPSSPVPARSSSRSPLHSRASPSPTLAPTAISSLTASDTSLLQTIYLLSILRTKSNIAAFVRSGGLVEFTELGEDELEKRGRKVCEEAGIEVKEEWEEGWWEACQR